MISPAPIYADEVSAIVIDLGSHTCKAGYAGEDAPKAVFPSDNGPTEDLMDGLLQKEFLISSFASIKDGQRHLHFQLIDRWASLANIRHKIKVCPPQNHLLALGILKSILYWRNPEELRKGGIKRLIRYVELLDIAGSGEGVYVVGSIDQTGGPDAVKSESDTKNGASPFDSDKNKAKRKLYVGSQALGYRRDHMEVLSPLKDGVVIDWDIVENIWDHAFRERLLIDPTEHPMLLAEPSSSTPQQRERTAELMFERYKVPALFLAKNAVLTSFASGRATSLVVDSGGGSTTVAAVHDGYVIQKAVATSPVGGEFLTDCMLKSLESKGIMRVIASDIKECVCRAPDTAFDGLTIEIGADKFKIPDILFNPSLVQTIPGVESRVKVNLTQTLDFEKDQAQVAFGLAIRVENAETKWKGAKGRDVNEYGKLGGGTRICSKDYK
ncbi:Actin-related protein 4 [Asimina triloba]